MTDPDCDPRASLSFVERLIVAALLDGNSYTAIAAQLHRSRHTIKHVMADLRERRNAATNEQLIATLFRSGELT